MIKWTQAKAAQTLWCSEFLSHSFYVIKYLRRNLAVFVLTGRMDEGREGKGGKAKRREYKVIMVI